MAGESARESARRMREKAERLNRSAELWERGAEGERATAQALAALPAAEWAVFHDIAWPGRALANVDHVVVGPGGVFVIDAKNWSGRIAVKDDVLLQNGRRREPAVAGAAEAALAVATLCPMIVPQHVFPVLCFARDERVTGWARDVMVCSTSTVVEMLTSREPVLPPEVRRDAAMWLDAQSRPAGVRGRRRPAAAHDLTDLPRHRGGESNTCPRPGRRQVRGPSFSGQLIRLALGIVALLALLSILPALGRAVGQQMIDGVTPTQTPSPSQHGNQHAGHPRKHPKPTGR